MPDAALKSGPHRKSLQTGRVSGTADEERLAERNSREQALQLKPEFSGYTCAAAHSAIATVWLMHEIIPFDTYKPPHTPGATLHPR